MVDFIINKIKKNKVIVKYGIAGIIASLLELVLLYYLVDYLNYWYLIGSTLSFLFGMILSFVLRKFWAFRNKETGARKITKQLVFYLFISGISLILNLWAVYLMVESGRIHYLMAQLISVTLISVLGFIFNRAITFKVTK